MTHSGQGGHNFFLGGEGGRRNSRTFQKLSFTFSIPILVMFYMLQSVCGITYKLSTVNAALRTAVTQQMLENMQVTVIK